MEKNTINTNVKMNMVIGFKNGSEATIPFKAYTSMLSVTKNPDGSLKQIKLDNIYFVDIKEVNYVFVVEVD